jgi:glucose/arabinose dehydrogenase
MLFTPFSQLLFDKAVRQCPRRVASAVLLAGLLLVTALSVASPVAAATLPTGFTESLFATGLTNPTAMAFAPDGRLFVCEQSGQLRVIKNGALLATPFLTVTTDATGERGLLGIAFDPNFTSNQFLYIYYTATTPTIHNRVSRFTANGDVATVGSEVPILNLNDLSGATNHNGGSIHFGPDGKLYIGVGENANSANSQTISNLLGKMLRINSDGTIPSDNPTTFSGIAGSPTGNNRAIWAVGLRNPFTFAFQPGTGRMFINDVGQSFWEEIDDGIGGSNYGWALCEGLCSPANANFRDPLFQYGHQISSTTGCAIIGGAFYNPTTTTFPSDYIGKYFFADLCSGWIRRFDPATGTAVDFASGIPSPVELLVTNDGSLYYLERGDGSIFRITSSIPNVSGLIVDSKGNPVEGAAVRMTGTQNRLTVTDAAGNYHFDNVAINGFYTVTPSRANFTFNPSQRTFTQSGQHTDAAFTAAPTGAGLNPLDTTEYFVRQQYVDFLNREPDESGFNFWVNNIENCGSDANCRAVKRVDTAAAFFLSIEFQQTGYLVERIYKASYADANGMSTIGGLHSLTVPIIRLNEFLPDTQEVGRGVIVNQGNWQQQLENNKQAFTAEFVQRPRFTSALPTSLTPAQFVDMLFTNSGVTPSGTDRTAAINEFGSATTTTDMAARGRALRRVAENTTLAQQEFNRAFVLMQYFGYLRRNPNDPQDSDYSGYDFWLTKLNRFNGNYVAAEMVKAFLVSDEYRHRFGP